MTGATTTGTTGATGAKPVLIIGGGIGGPVALLGDAVHAVSPNSGQGASLAMEDGLVVARCLRDQPDQPDQPDPARAFAAYERLRRPRVERVVAYSRRLGQSKALGNPVARWMRDLILPFALKHFASPEAHAWLYTYRVDRDAPIDGGGAAPAARAA
jgi:2-polyprenyl-6-methoxyphenol hydroxylase-like FAD-dependent oxidoreductase